MRATRTALLVLSVACVASLTLGCVSTQNAASESAAYSAERVVYPSDVSSENLQRLMAEIEVLAVESTGGVSCSFKFRMSKNSVTLNLTTHDAKLQTVRMPAELRIWTEGSAGERTLFLQGKKYFACGSYTSETARDLVAKLHQLNTMLLRNTVIKAD